jgi:hypothetical protein
MKGIKTNSILHFISLDMDRISTTPGTKDIFNYSLDSGNTLIIRYKLRLYDDYSAVIGELQAEYSVVSNQLITPFDIDQFVCDLSVWGREQFNIESARHNIRIFLPRPQTLLVYRDADAA